MKQKIANTLRIIILSLILSATIGYSLADWAPPTGNPPLGNVPPPINVGPATQEKAGNLVLSGPTGTLIAKNGFFSNALGIGVPSIRGGKSLDMNGDANIGPLGGAGRIYVASSTNHFYGDSVNLAARQSGAFYVQNAAGTALGPLNAGAIGATKVTAGTAAGQGFCLGPTNCITDWPNLSINTLEIAQGTVYGSGGVTNFAQFSGPAGAIIVVRNVAPLIGGADFSYTGNDGGQCNAAQGWRLGGCWSGRVGSDVDIMPYTNGCVTNDFNGSARTYMTIQCLRFNP